MRRFSVMNSMPRLLVMMFCTALQVRDIDGITRTPLVLHHGQQAVVLIFVGVECPISNSYAPELNRICRDYAGKALDFFIVYSDPALSPAAAKRHSKDFGYTCPSLLDSRQVLMKRAGATVTPEAVVIDSRGIAIYRGRIDNWFEDFGKQRFAATTHDLRDALDAVLAGKKVLVPVTKAVGCPI